MIKLLHIIAIGALVASAVYAYSIKYDSIFLAERTAKLKNRIQKEKDSIAVLKAEWQRLNRPERLQALAARHLDLHQVRIDQIVRYADVPQRQPKVDEIGRKLEALGLGVPTSTPNAPTGAISTPASRPTP